LYGVKNWTVPKVDQKYLERWKCCVWGGCIRSVWLIMWDMKKCYKELRRTEISYKK
jgi:hypothetical protein